MLILLAIVLLALSPSAASAQQTVTLNVHVVEEGTGTPLAGASVELVGTESRITDKNGNTRFSKLTRTRHTLVVRMLGHTAYDETLLLIEDRSITVTLPVSVIQLDPLVVQSRSFRLYGEVTGADTRRAIPDADVAIGGKTTRSDDGGFFKMSKLPANEPISITIESMGYLPKTVTINASGDTTIKTVLDVDPVGQAMVAAQLKRLDQATKGGIAPTRKLERADVLRDAGNVLDILKYHGVTSIRCLYVDAKRIRSGTDYLLAIPRDAVERIEMTRNPMNSTYSVRVYTYSYVRRELPKVENVSTAMQDNYCY